MKYLIIALLLTGCASKPVALPSRPTPTNTEGAACLGLCDEKYVSCTSSTFPTFMLDGRAMLIGSILNGNTRGNKQKICAEFLKYCYNDCEEFE